MFAVDVPWVCVPLAQLSTATSSESKAFLVINSKHIERIQLTGVLKLFYMFVHFGDTDKFEIIVSQWNLVLGILIKEVSQPLLTWLNPWL